MSLKAYDYHATREGGLYDAEATTLSAKDTTCRHSELRKINRVQSLTLRRLQL